MNHDNAHSTDNPLSEAAIRRQCDELCVHMLYRQLRTSVTGTMLGVFLLASAVWSVEQSQRVFIWVALMCANQGLRLWLYLRYLRHGIEPERFPAATRVWFAGALVSGLLWGAAYLLFFPAELPIYQTVLTVLIFGVAAGAVPLIASHIPSFYAFIVPALLPIIIRNALENDAPHLTVAFVSAVVTWGILSFGRGYHRHLIEATTARVKNEALALRLAAQNTQLEVARDAAEEANRAKTRFFAAASHDLRQPLHAIGLFADLLASRLGRSENGRLAGNIHASAGMLESLLSELLNLSRIDAGVITPEAADFDLRELLERLNGDFEAEALGKGLHLRLHVSAAMPVHSDPYLVERILRNLISNAIRYTDRGGVLFGCRRHGSTVWVEIWDTGVGIAAEHHQAVFEEFRQLANPERNPNKGLGLGLSIVKRLAEILDLPLAMHSRPGRGTRFRLGLPAANEIAPAADEPATAPNGFRDRSILLVDDEEAVRQGTAALLEGWGAKVTACPDLTAAQAAAAGATAPPDLIVSNYIVSGQGGGEMVAALRQTIGQPVPAIVLAGAVTPERSEEARRIGFHLLVKPVPPSKLRALMSAMLARGGNDADL